MKLFFTLLSINLIFCAYKIEAQTLNYYFGNIHAHSSYSDGNKDSATSTLTTPLEDFNYANASQQIDFYGISEHNHASAGMASLANYHQGVADADSATDSAFVAMYGMEWGVISGGGHVIVYGTDSLFGWDANLYDVFVSQNDYANLWKNINKVSNAFGYFAHPDAADYNSLFTTAVDMEADNAIVGSAARSGPAFSTNSTYSNPYTGSYIARYNDALKRGYHLGVGLDHDTHNSVFGRQTAGRLVVLAQSLTRANIIQAMRKMRFYSSDDWNLKVNFTINSQPMGSIIAHTGTPTITATVTDPDASESITSIVIYYGIPGSGITPTTLNSVSNTNTISYTHNIANNTTYYYYLKVTEADGDIVWTSPIWYTRNDALTSNPPVADFSASTYSTCTGQDITFTDNSTNGAGEWNWSLPGGIPNASDNRNFIASYNTAGTYNVSLTTVNSFGVSNTITKTIVVNATPNVVITHNGAICKGETDTLTVSGASSYLWNTGDTNPVLYVSPLSSTTYSVTGTIGSCSASYNLLVTVKSVPNVYIISKNICKGQTDTLTAIGANSYLWNNGSSSPVIYVSPDTTTSYTVVGTGNNGCKKSYTVTVVVNDCTGIFEPESSFVKIFPNPANDLITIDIDNLTGKKSVEIYDISGKLIFAKTGFGKQINLDLSSLKNGNYLVKVIADNKVFGTHKFIVSHPNR